MKRIITTIALTFSAYYVVEHFNITEHPSIILVGWFACLFNDMLNSEE